LIQVPIETHENQAIQPNWEALIGVKNLLRTCLAEQLACCPGLEGAEALLLDLAAGADEYVRRRALMALGRIKSGQVETLVREAWDSGDEYQRMAVLDALHDVRSKKLALYLDMAQADGGQYLTAYAGRIRRGEVPIR